MDLLYAACGGLAILAGCWLGTDLKNSRPVRRASWLPTVAAVGAPLCFAYLGFGAALAWIAIAIAASLFIGFMLTWGLRG